MADLILITIGNSHPVPCSDLNDAKAKALMVPDRQVVIEITPAGSGGPITTLEFDRITQDWVPF